MPLSYPFSECLILLTLRYLYCINLQELCLLPTGRLFKIILSNENCVVQQLFPETFSIPPLSPFCYVPIDRGYTMTTDCWYRARILAGLDRLVGSSESTRFFPGIPAISGVRDVTVTRCILFEWLNQ